MTRAEVRFQGHVQGVGFRATAESVSRGFSVAGWVRNEAGGTVFLAVEGEAGEIDRFLEALCRRLARHIAKVDRTDHPPQGEQGFEVRR